MQESMAKTILPMRGVESVIGSMSPTIVEKIVIASRIVTPEKWCTGNILRRVLVKASPGKERKICRFNSI